ncbi:hypothetical protein J6590_106731, partial [Homalodisca vitripennis]
NTSLTVKAPNHLDLMTLASEETQKISQWFQHYQLVVNNEKTQMINFSIRSSQDLEQITFRLGDEEISS